MATLPAQGSLRSRTAATVSSLTLRHISAARRCWPVPQSHSPRIFVPRADSVKCRSGRLIMWGRVIKRSRNADAVITGAGSGIGAAPQMAAYNVGKVGVLSVSETLPAELADRLMRWTGFSAQRVARTCLDTHDRGDLYCMPQLDARLGWHGQRLAPHLYTRAVGLTQKGLT